MYVVRVENDEAVMYRAFRRFQSAKIWAAERDAESADCLTDILETPYTDDPKVAVANVKSGRSEVVLRAEAMVSIPAALPSGSDIQFGRLSAGF